jgi:DNA-binding NarL/FixJ family response regulator
MVAAGAANREIAARLFITEGTVKNHVSSVLRKLALRDRIQLALRVKP